MRAGEMSKKGWELVFSKLFHCNKKTQVTSHVATLAEGESIFLGALRMSLESLTRSVPRCC